MIQQSISRGWAIMTPSRAGSTSKPGLWIQPWFLTSVWLKQNISCGGLVLTALHDAWKPRLAIEVSVLKVNTSWFEEVRWIWAGDASQVWILIHWQDKRLFLSSESTQIGKKLLQLLIAICSFLSTLWCRKRATQFLLRRTLLSLPYTLTKC